MIVHDRTRLTGRLHFSPTESHVEQQKNNFLPEITSEVQCKSLIFGF